MLIINRINWYLALLLLVFSAGLLSTCTINETIPLPSTPTPSLTIFPTFTIPIQSTSTLEPLVSATFISTTAIPDIATPTFTVVVYPSATPTFDNQSWRVMPIIPGVSQTIKEIFAHGQELGNNPQAFTKIGDCETAAQWFLGDYDLKPDQYSLGSYSYLQAVIQQFSGSFNRISQAARIGFNAASVLNPIWADPKQCHSDENPLECEYRIVHPAFAFILLGTNDVYHVDSFESNLKKIIEFSIQQGVIPILATKASNLEGEHSINITITRLAYEYDIPLWNFWLAVQPLPNGGLQADNEHLTWNPNFFDNPYNMKAGWTVRNLTALEALLAIWQGVTSH